MCQEETGTGGGEGGIGGAEMSGVCVCVNMVACVSAVRVYLWALMIGGRRTGVLLGDALCAPLSDVASRWACCCHR